MYIDCMNHTLIRMHALTYIDNTFIYSDIYAQVAGYFSKKLCIMFYYMLYTCHFNKRCTYLLITYIANI